MLTKRIKRRVCVFQSYAAHTDTHIRVDFIVWGYSTYQNGSHFNKKIKINSNKNRNKIEHAI